MYTSSKQYIIPPFSTSLNENNFPGRNMKNLYKYILSMVKIPSFKGKSVTGI